MERVRAMHPDMKFVYNQGASFVLSHPELADGFEDEGIFSALSAPAAYLQPWLDPYYWGPQFKNAKAIQAKNIPVIVAEYFDPRGAQARQVFDAIAAHGFVPYITSDHWDVSGMGLNVSPGW